MDIDQLLKQLNIKPKDKEIFYRALTHSTFANEKRYVGDYQRLEFVGDALLEQATALKTYHLYPNLDEGSMTIIRANAVNSKQLANFSIRLGLDKVIRFGGSAKDLISNIKILADVFESFVAAIYLDLGETEMNKFLDGNVYKFIVESKGKNLKNPKTILQEYLQLESRETVVYKTAKLNDGFISRVFHEGTTYGQGNGHTKKQAEINAAKDALEKVNIKNEIN